MKVFTCTDHDCVWPVGVASVVCAESEKKARKLLDAELVKRNLHPHAKKPYTLKQLPESPIAVILRDGDY